MAGAPSDPDSGAELNGGSAPTPRWVKVFGLIALVVIVLFVVLLLTGRGEHGPGRHARADRAGEHRPPSSVTHEPPSSGTEQGAHRR